MIEIDNPLAGPSPYEFDQYDRSVVDYRICNDALAHGLSPERARENLKTKVEALIMGLDLINRARAA